MDSKKDKTLLEIPLEKSFITPFEQSVIFVQQENPEFFRECLMRVLDNQGNFVLPSTIVTNPHHQDYPIYMQMMIHNVCDFFGQPARRNQNFSINLHAQDFLRDDIMHTLERAVEHYGLQKNMVIEILEVLPADLDVDNFIGVVKNLVSVGIKIAVDDWPQKQSGQLLEALGENVSILKLDRINLRTEEHTIRRIVDFAHDKGITVIGEGVESDVHQQRYIDCGVDALQGFKWGIPQEIK